MIMLMQFELLYPTFLLVAFCGVKFNLTHIFLRRYESTELLFYRFRLSMFCTSYQAIVKSDGPTLAAGYTWQTAVGVLFFEVFPYPALY